ncbi:RNA-directed DNA polymerase, eukaryota, reverse transcriptase zinc-binding domain protein [Tanacetum coccineum]
MIGVISLEEIREVVLKLLNYRVCKTLLEMSYVGPNATRWNRAIPIKANVFLWRLALNKLPSRVNLEKKGIDVDSLLCPICNDDVETVNHIFLSCDMAKDLCALLAR